MHVQGRQSIQYRNYTPNAVVELLHICQDHGVRSVSRNQSVHKYAQSMIPTVYFVRHAHTWCCRHWYECNLSEARVTGSKEGKGNERRKKGRHKERMRSARMKE